MLNLSTLKVTRPFAYVWFCILHVFVYVVLPTCFILSNQLCACWLHTMYGCYCWAYCILIYLLGSWEWLMDHPILGEWYALALHNPKYVCTWGIPLSVYILNYLVSMWYVMLMRNSNSIMSINFSSCFCLPLALKKIWFITLWGSNKLCAYYKPRKCEHVRFCHLELMLSIILLLCGMLLKQGPFLLNCF